MKKQLSLVLMVVLSVWIGWPAVAQTSLTYVPLAPMPDGGRYGMAYCQDQTYLYSIGGGSLLSAFTSDVYRYDPAANSWGVAPLSTGQIAPQRFGTAAIIPPATSTSLIYTLNAASTTAPVPTLQSLRVSDGVLAGSLNNPLPAASAALAVWNGLLYAYGGLTASSSGAYTNQLRVFNPATGTWTTLAAMPEAKTTYGAAVGGKLYAFGGYNGVADSNRIDAYDIATNTWQPLGTLPTTVSNQAVAVQGELIWMVGDFVNQSYLAAYNTRTGQLRTFTSNLPPRRNAAAAIVGNFLYVWGGNTASSNASTLSDVWRANVQSVATAATEARVLAPLQAYPSPSVTGRFTLTLPGSIPAQLLVTDAQGRTICQQEVPAGSSTFELDLVGQAVGLYQVRWQAEGQAAAVCRIVRQ
ncbi:MAG: hypothetical protein JWR44_1942 [Hymenobacter sp.]|nr:hypothetical protein [Hymenobacter sp.]